MDLLLRKICIIYRILFTVSGGSWISLITTPFKNFWYRDFPGGTVVENPPANAGDMGSGPGPGRPYMPWSS